MTTLLQRTTLALLLLSTAALSACAGGLSPLEEMLLVSAARCSHVRDVVRPALGRRYWVVCDRFTLSTFALQIFGTGVDEALFRALTEAVTGGLQPDVTFILDLPVEQAAARRRSRRDGMGAEATG